VVRFVVGICLGLVVGMVAGVAAYDAETAKRAAAIDWSGRRLSIIDGTRLTYYPLEWGEDGNGRVVTRPWIEPDRDEVTR
jgi:hypothetical protein